MAFYRKLAKWEDVWYNKTKNSESIGIREVCAMKKVLVYGSDL